MYKRQEMDHSGALPAMVKACPNATIITSAPSGLKGLTAHYGNLNYKPMKTGDTLNIGARNLNFVTTPMLHWPDNMVTYCQMCIRDSRRRSPPR